MSTTIYDDFEQIPGTERLVTKDETHDHGRSDDIILIPAPTDCGGDPLTWSKYKKYWQLLLLGAYAMAFNYGENTLGAAWNTASEASGVPLSDMNGGSALNYLLLGFGNMLWIPVARKIGRRPVFIMTLALSAGSLAWAGNFVGKGQWYAYAFLNGVATSAYEALIQLSIFDFFYTHERGRCIAFYVWAQQVGAVVGLITGGKIADSLGWRWTKRVPAIASAIIFVLFIIGFEETMFPRFLFSSDATLPTRQPSPNEDSKDLAIDGTAVNMDTVSDHSELLQRFPKRSYLQMLKPWTWVPEDKMSFFDYFRLPLRLWRFPNIIMAGFIFAFGCTAGIVSFNTLSVILSAEPYNFTDTSTGLLYFSALIGAVLGWATGTAGDYIVIALARRNNGIKEPEMRLWVLVLSFIYAAVGYMSYGWGAATGAHWMSIAVGVTGMIATQVSVCSTATTYAMDCYGGVSGEIVTVLAICSSIVNFPISMTVSYFTNAVGFGWQFFCYGLWVLLAISMAVPLIMYGKKWRQRGATHYYRFLSERSHPTVA